MPSLKPNGKRVNGKRGGGWIVPTKRLAIYLRDEFACVYCGRDLHDASPRELTLDHLQPRCKDGNNDPSNLITACLSCNSRRQHKRLIPFIRQMTAEFGMVSESSQWCRETVAAKLRRINRNRRRSLKRYAVLARDIITSRREAK